MPHNATPSPGRRSPARRAPGRPFLPGVALALTLASGGCGGDDAPVPGGEERERPAQGDAARQLPVPAYEDLPILYRDRQLPVTDGVRAQMRRLAAAADGWTTEVFAEHAEARLTAFLQHLLDPAAPASELDAWLAPEWEGIGALVPKRVETDFDDGFLRVDRGVELDSELASRERIPEIAAALRESFAATSGDFEGVSVELVLLAVREDAGIWKTQAAVQLAARGAAPLQRDLVLAVTWSAADPAAPLLRSVRLEGFHEARAATPLFADVTRRVMGETPRFETDILRGVDEYFGRIDRQGGVSFQGMQGIAVGDVDGDGREDVFVCQQVGLPNQLLIRNRDGTVTDRADLARVDLLNVTRAALILDLDNDGYQDLVQAIGSNVVLCFGEGAGKFGRPQVLQADGQAQFYNLSAADADGDGDLDLYAGRYAAEGVLHGVPSPYHDASNGATNYFWTNDGSGGMTDATGPSGLGAGNTKFTLASIWEDFDDDGDLDLYVVNDFGRNNLFQNDGEGRFTDVAGASGAVDIGAGMGATCSDFDLDGDVDLYVTNMWSAPGMRVVQQSQRFMGGEQGEVHRWYAKHASGNSLLANQGDGTFEDVTRVSGGGLGRWAWGGKFVDFDNDGYEDLYVPCGQTTRRGATVDLESFFWRGVISLSPADSTSDQEYEDAFNAIHHMAMYEDFHWNGLERNVVYQNLGGGRFADVSVVSGADFLGDARAVALVDWDEDGRQDLVLKNRTAPRVQILHNRSGAGGGFVAFELEGRTCNRDAIGARAVVEVGGRTLRKRIYAGDGYLSQSSKRLHFGLADAERVERVTIEWPDGTRDVHEDLEAGRRYRILQGAAEAEPAAARPKLAQRFARYADDEPEPSFRPVTRVALAAKLPMSALSVPSTEDPGRRVESFAGAPLLLHLWTAADPSGEVGLAELRACVPKLGKVGARVAALSVDEGADLARARKLAGALGIETGYADGRARAAFEVLLLEILGHFDEVPLPLSFLIDSSGQAVAVYIGMPFADELRADLPRLAAIDPGSPATIQGGRQLVPNERRLRMLAKTFRRTGYPELATYYGGLASAARREDR